LGSLQRGIKRGEWRGAVYISGRIKINTPIIKSIRRSRGGTSIGPKPNILDATSDRHRQRVILPIEHQVVPSFPDAPGNRGGDSSLRNIAAASAKEVEEGSRGSSRQKVVEEAPGFLRSGAGEEKVIDVLIKAT
jgi:hypothetical protein